MTMRVGEESPLWVGFAALLLMIGAVAVAWIGPEKARGGVRGSATARGIVRGLATARGWVPKGSFESRKVGSHKQGRRLHKHCYEGHVREQGE